jgi:hypothetical protein
VLENAADGGFCADALDQKLARVLTVGYRGTDFRLKDTKGLGYLALLGFGRYADPLARGFERIGAPL